VPLLSQDWDWYAFIIEMTITILIAVGVVNVLGVARTTRMWCANLLLLFWGVTVDNQSIGFYVLGNACYTKI
jgi:hypothetical protein